MRTDLSCFCVRWGSSLREAMTLMTASRLGIVLVVTEEGHLVGTITDGDVRRAMLASIDLDAPAETLLSRKADSPFSHPITVTVGADRSRLLKLFQKHKIFHLPVLDDKGCVVGMVCQEEFLPDGIPSVRAVVMAGGKGRRLRRLTRNLPKPMLPIGDRPLMEVIIRQLREAGIRRVNVTVHHRPEKITEYFGDGSGFDMDLTYVEEDQPLGTAGGLSLIEPEGETILVINGDVCTRVNYRAMVAYHREHNADLTVAVAQHRVEIPYGVVECDGPLVARLKEKPVLTFFVSAGIYLLEPAVHRCIPYAERFDMTDVIQRLLREGGRVLSFPIHEYWLDIGRPVDYERAQTEFHAGSAASL